MKTRKSKRRRMKTTTRKLRLIKKGTTLSEGESPGLERYVLPGDRDEGMRR